MRIADAEQLPAESTQLNSNEIKFNEMMLIASTASTNVMSNVWTRMPGQVKFVHRNLS